MTSHTNGDETTPPRETKILPVDPSKIGEITLTGTEESLLDNWNIQWDESSPDTQRLRQAAQQLRGSNIPVAFPTETVYGLGADATRSAAVRGIYKAKQRPSDNPLIVHIASLQQLRQLLKPDSSQETSEEDFIPEIYKPLITRFWPGPLTIILANPPNSKLAPEVTAGLSTFGARIPRSILALSLIKLSGVPLAAPSANASTKPSPTAAEHVKFDLDGRIETIIDGGPCDVGVESTVVDGLSEPPAILRPGGVSIEQLRQCPGWENVILGYKDAAMGEGAKPRAPGMKYRHYSPRARVVLFEASAKTPDLDGVRSYVGEEKKFGFIRTRRWRSGLEFEATGKRDENVVSASQQHPSSTIPIKLPNGIPSQSSVLSNLLKSFDQHRIPVATHLSIKIGPESEDASDVWEVNLGADLEEIARGLFSALRELDQKGVSVILVEGVADDLGSVAAAVMNRLRKAAEVIVKE